MLKLMANVVGQQLAEVLPDPVGMLREHMLWIFGVHSGMAHGHAWPDLVPGTGSLPGHFISDLFLIASTVQLAFDLAWRRTEPTGSVPS
ncbi:hypothetical protein [Raineyella sp.]|uniref:Uncharacterized protein n=1 Tax=bioreactor metagenome TaxID=1076179 RepID=A0A645BN61_9ZZZZ|nr:hypothetical protein [Raineyella sp.]MEA5155413.1 hypothetical protein [Raineyella sp.]